MKLKEVKYEDLSKIKYKIYVSEHEEFREPEFLVIKFSGTYRYGNKGAPDARFMLGTIRGAIGAWHSMSIILDLSKLKYDWGDEMNDVIDIGFGLSTECEFPLVVVVSEKCRDGLKKLLRTDYDTYCREDLEQAYTLGREKIHDYMACQEASRGET